MAVPYGIFFCNHSIALMISCIPDHKTLGKPFNSFFGKKRSGEQDSECYRVGQDAKIGIIGHRHGRKLGQARNPHFVRLCI